jgi:Protein of unknown function (DUF3800)
METLTKSHNPLSKRNLPKIVTWELTDKRPCSISGVDLQGDRLLRTIYLDETGISANDKIALVAGVIINEDEQWKSVEAAVSDLIDKYVPEEHRDGFSFHAKDLYHCSGKVFDHKKFGYPRERAREALKELLSIPRRFRLPISIGYVSKPAMEISPEFMPRDAASFFHGYAYFMCVMSAEIYMVDRCGPKDLARLVAENNTDTHKVIKEAHKVLRGKADHSSVKGITDQLESMKAYLPIRRIVDTVHFVEKDDAILLQLADACAFLFRFWAERKSGQYIDEYFEAFLGDGKAIRLYTDSPAFYGTFTFEDSKIAKK